VWLVGEQGAALHWDGAQLTTTTTPTTDTLYGVWGAAANDVWAVGGQPGGVSATVLHWDGSAWSKVDPGLTFTGAYFKVWGASANCVYLVGESATIARFDGMKWSPMQSGAPANQTLLTVTGRACDDAWVVGGFGDGIALHYDGASWSPPDGLDVSQSSGLAGVAVDAAGDVVMVGSAGAKFRRPAGGAWADDSRQPPGDDFHGAWIDAPDDAWAVGGNYIAPPPTVRQGIVARFASQ
jgi:hypothetical protein